MNPRVLIVTFSYPPNRDGVAGAAALMAEGLALRGFQVLVATLYHANRDPQELGANPEVQQFRIDGLTWRDKVSGEIAKFEELVGSFQGDAVLCHTLEAALSLLAVRSFAQLAAPKVLISHGYAAHMINWHPKFPWGVNSWLLSQPFVWRLPRLLMKFDRLVFLSRRKDWKRFFDHRVARVIGHRGIRVIPNGVDWKTSGGDISGFFKQHGILGKLTFLCLANYCDRKNQLLALRAYRRARIANSALVFVGSELNDYSQQMAELDRSLQQSCPEGMVIILEKIGRDVTEALLQSMDIFLLSAKQETQPIVLLESMAAAKPFVSTDTGCVRELSGGLIANTEEQLAEHLGLLANNAKLREQLGSEGQRDFVVHYRKEAVLDAYEELLRELISERGRQES